MKLNDSLRLFAALFLALLGLLKPLAVRGSDAAPSLYYDPINDRYFTAGQVQVPFQPAGRMYQKTPLSFRINGGEYQTFTGKLDLSNEGLFVVDFRAPDPVLKWSPVQTIRIFVDNSPPKTSYAFEGPHFERDGTHYIQPTTQILLEAQDAYSGVNATYWKFGDKIQRFPQKVKFEKEGKYHFEFRSLDQVKNTESWKSIDFVVDATAPITKPVVQGDSSLKGKELYLSAGSLVALEYQEKGAGIDKIEYQIDKLPIAAYHQPLAITQAKTEIRFRAIDAIGNTESWKSFTVYMDNKAPLLSLKREGHHVLRKGLIFAQPGFSIIPEARDDESGIEGIYLKSQNEDKWIKTSKSKLEYQKPGQYEVAVRVADKVGNVTESESLTIVIDHQAPDTQLRASSELKKTDRGFLASIPNIIHLECEESGVGVLRTEYSFDGRNYVAFTNDLDLSKWKTPSRTLYYRSIDRLGNSEAPKKMTIWIESTIPQADLYVEAKSYSNVPLSKVMNQGESLSDTEETPNAVPSSIPSIEHAQPVREVPKVRAPASNLIKKSTEKSNKTSKKKTKKGKRSR